MSSVFTVTRDQVIALSLRKLGVLEIGDTPDSATLTNASLSLNLLIKQMSTEGLKMWKNSELMIPLVSSQTVYTLGGATSDVMYDVDNGGVITDRPLKIIQAFYRNVSTTPYIDTPVMTLSQQEYNVLGSKGSTGVANSLYYSTKKLSGLLHVYLTPDSYVAANLELHCIAQMPLDDLSSALDVPDFPNEWMNCLVWNLADQLAIEYGVPLNYRQEIGSRALLYKNQLTDWDVEASSTFFQPDMRMSTQVR
jgi:hypothetical protein